MFTGVGIDISEHHIRFARVSWFGGVHSLDEIELPDGLIVDERVEELETVQELLAKEIEGKAYAKRKLSTTLLIPESRVFTSGFILPKALSKEDVDEEAQKRAQREIPIPFDQAKIAVAQGEQTDGGVRTTVYATQQDVYQGFVDVIQKLPLKLVAVESNTKSIFRLLQRHHSKLGLSKDSNTYVAVADIGHSWATISVYSPKGSNMFSRSISAKHLGVRKGATKKLSKKFVDMIIQTIQDVVLYFEQRDGSIEKIFLSGVEAMDPSLVKAIDTITNEQTSVQLVGDALTIRGVSKEDLHTYGAAIGSALRSAHAWRYAKHHNFNV